MGRHTGLALMHVVHPNQLGQAGVSLFALYQMMGHDADNVATMLQYRVSQCTHQADFCTTIDQAMAAQCQFTAERLSSGHESRVSTCAGAQVDTESRHVFSFADKSLAWLRAGNRSPRTRRRAIDQ